MTTKDDKPAASKAPVVDGDALSAPDQEELQQLHVRREGAVARGDKQAVADIDARLKELAGNKE
jgi:hypothetical protein